MRQGLTWTCFFVEFVSWWFLYEEAKNIKSHVFPVSKEFRNFRIFVVLLCYFIHDQHQKSNTNKHGITTQKKMLSRFVRKGVRQFSVEAKAMENQLRSALNASDVNVEDISGGCGSMYRVEVESPMFSGVSLVKQHRMVNEVLKSEITGMHGLTISTRAPKKK